ncbi:MAG: type II CAAX endopeptidase family protein [Phenylobacterium sp.]|nr:type II CAAX endopeptidase family protein [Phenylobacterium sp.]
MRMMTLALVLLTVWVFATVAPTLQQASGNVSIPILISTRIEWGLIAAPTVLAISYLLLRWNRLGLRWPARPSAFVLGWPMLACVVVMAVVSVQAGLPPAQALGLIAFNTFFVGISEELMFRGFLFRGLIERLSFWITFWLSSLMFGMVHTLNGFITGDFNAAIIQAGSAFLSAIFFLAVRLRTASLYPGILLHWTWDLAVITLGLSLAANASEPASTSFATKGIGAVLLSAPFALYGLFLMRKGRASCPEWAEPRAGSSATS